MLALGVVLGSADALAADYPGAVDGPSPPSAPRFFPRSDGVEPVGRPLSSPNRRFVACTPRQVPIPTDAPDDPSYVGSPYGLGKPSYYGFRPPFGNDDPSSRPLRYCP